MSHLTLRGTSKKTRGLSSRKCLFPEVALKEHFRVSEVSAEDVQKGNTCSQADQSHSQFLLHDSEAMVHLYTLH